MGVLWRGAGLPPGDRCEAGLEEPFQGREERGRAGRQCPQAAPVGWNIGLLCPCQPPPLSPSGPPREEEPRRGCIFSSLCLPSCYKTPLPAPSPAPGRRLQEDSWGEGETWSVGGCQGREEWVEGSSGVWGKLGGPTAPLRASGRFCGSGPTRALSLA